MYPNVSYRVLYLDNRQHSLIVVWVGLNLKALRRVSTDYRVHGSPRCCGRIVSVIYRQVDHNARWALIHMSFKLLGETETSWGYWEAGWGYPNLENITEQISTIPETKTWIHVTLKASKTECEMNFRGSATAYWANQTWMWTGTNLL